jgi:hypothetical protein
MAFAGVWEWLEETWISLAIRESWWAFPTIESFHVIAVAIVVGTIAIVDLRLLGVASNKCGITELSDDILPWTWGAFVLAGVTGLLMFVSNPESYFENVPFRFKIVFLMLAGLNMLIFQFVTFRRVADWDRDCETPMAGKIAGTLSLLFWIGVIAFGRWIGFTLH